MGDGAYPLLPWLMKAYGNTQLMPQEELFNMYFNRRRVHVEMAFGRLKSRWRTLLKRNELNYQFVPDIVAACALHNILEIKKDPFLNAWIDYVKETENIFSQPENLSWIYNDYNANQIHNALRDHVAELQSQ